MLKLMQDIETEVDQQLEGEEKVDPVLRRRG